MMKVWSGWLVCVLTLPACGGDDGMRMDQPETPARDAKGDAQTPPTTNALDVRSWLVRSFYKSWTCEDVEHPQMKVSPHGHNRVCSNDLVATFDGRPGDERPKGSASVKELYNDASELRGYAMAVKLNPNSDAGKNWYWYEFIGGEVTLDGLGSEAKVNAACVSCHAAAGADEMHSVGSSADFVYLQVKN